MAKLNSSLGAQAVAGIGAPMATIPNVLGNPALLAAAQQQAGLLNSGLASAPAAVIPPPGIAIPQLRAPAQIQPLGKCSNTGLSFAYAKSQKGIIMCVFSLGSVHHSSTSSFSYPDCCWPACCTGSGCIQKSSGTSPSKNIQH